MHGNKVLGILILIFTIHSNVLAQYDNYRMLEIPHFIKEIQSNEKKFQLPHNDLSNLHIDIQWLILDRRFIPCFKDRLSSYIDKDRIQTYILNHVPQISKPKNFTIFVIDEKMELPPQLENSMIIDLAETSRSEKTTLPYYHFSRYFLHCMNFDLLAQYIFKGIKINNDNRLESDQRISFLPAQYLGLDEYWMNERINYFLNLGLDSMAYPGAQLVITYKGSVIFNKNIGYHTYDREYLVRKDDVFDLASVTKVVAGVSALMTLYENKQFDIDATLKDYFPYFKNNLKGDLTFRRILSHSAGLQPYIVYYALAEKNYNKYYRKTFSKYYRNKYNYPIAKSLYLSDQFLDFIKKSIASSPLDSIGMYKYSGLSFLLYPELILNQTGQSIDQYLSSKIYKPLGASRILYNPLIQLNIHETIPTEKDTIWRKRLIHGSVHDEAAAVLKGVSTNAGLFANAIDLTKLAETWRRKGEYGGKTYWKSSTIDTFSQCAYCEEGNRRGLGFDRGLLPNENYTSYMSPLASESSFGHSGFTGTMIWVDPEYEYTFVFLSNRVYPTRENRALYNLNIRPELHSILYQAIQKSK